MARRQLNLRIALIGKTGVGKSACGNTILGGSAFKSTLHASTEAECKKEKGEVHGQPVAVVDTPGLFDTGMEMKGIMRKIARSVCYVAPGPHVFLIVIHPTRHTKSELDTVKILQMVFGKEASKYSMVLFSHGDDLEAEDPPTTIETVIGKKKPLRDLISQCDGRYHVFNNRDKGNHGQVPGLLEKITRMVEMNGGKCFTNDMFQAAWKALKEEMKHLSENRGVDLKEIREKAEEEVAAAAVTKGATKGTAKATPLGREVGEALAVLRKSNACPIQ